MRPVMDTTVDYQQHLPIDPHIPSWTLNKRNALYRRWCNALSHVFERAISQTVLQIRIAIPK